jgi:hypothetical protein
MRGGRGTATGGAFPASAHETALDKLTMLVQQKSEENARSLLFPVSDPSSSLGELPNSIDRASRYLGFDAQSKPAALVAPEGGNVVSAFMATMLDDTNESAARATLGVTIGTDVLSPTGDGSGLTGIGSETDLRLAFLLIAENAGDRLNMVDGIADPFTDETDVDTATSTNETYNPAGDFYSNPGAQTLGNFGVSKVNSFNIGDGIANRKYFGIAFTPGAAGDIASVALDIFAVTTSYNCHVEIWTDSAGSPGTQVEGDSVTINLNTTGVKTFTWSAATPTLSASTTYWAVFVDEGTTGVVQLYEDDDGDKTDFVTGASDTLTSIANDTNVNGDTIHEIIVGGGTPPDMTLVSNAFTADAAPDTGRIHIQVNPIDSITINTDLTAEISRGNGEWSTATLVLVGTLADGTKAYEDDSIDLSGQTSGTAMKWRAKTLNNKEVEAHGVVLQWT